MTKHHDDKKVLAKLNKTIEKVSHDITSVKYNTAVAAMMEFLNEYEKTPHLSKENAKKFLQILAPFAPFMTDYIWRNLMEENTSIHVSEWPTFDETAVHLTEVSIPIQVNGKLRSVITVPAHELDKDKVVLKAEQDEKVVKFILGKIYEPVYVRGKVLNFVLKD
jgi:leucyl-tRNA synthetase